MDPVDESSDDDEAMVPMDTAPIAKNADTAEHWLHAADNPPTSGNPPTSSHASVRAGVLLTWT